jgi:hypothetical protein
MSSTTTRRCGILWIFCSVRRASTSRCSNPPIFPLTRFLDGLIAGLSNKLIAKEYDISPRTIEVYRANVMTKMQAGSLSELVRLAMRAGALKD